MVCLYFCLFFVVVYIFVYWWYLVLYIKCSAWHVDHVTRDYIAGIIIIVLFVEYTKHVVHEVYYSM